MTATAPLRIQLRRAKGWRMPANTLKADRSTPLGNPWRAAKPREVGFLCTDAELSAMCADRFTAACALRLPAVADILARLESLRGRNLACWCRLCPAHAAGKPFGTHCPDCAPCHTDTLGALANQPLACDAPDA